MNFRWPFFSKTEQKANKMALNWVNQNRFIHGFRPINSLNSVWWSYRRNEFLEKAKKTRK